MPPMIAIGITLIARNVSIAEPKLIHSRMAISPRVIGTTTLRRAMASWRLPNSPTHSIRVPGGSRTWSAIFCCASWMALPRSRSRTLNLIGR